MNNQGNDGCVGRTMGCVQMWGKPSWGPLGRKSRINMGELKANNKISCTTGMSRHKKIPDMQSILLFIALCSATWTWFGKGLFIHQQSKSLKWWRSRFLWRCWKTNVVRKKSWWQELGITNRLDPKELQASSSSSAVPRGPIPEFHSLIIGNFGGTVWDVALRGVGGGAEIECHH